LNGNQTTVDSQHHVRVGRIAKPHGIKGELKILPYGDVEDFRLYDVVLLAPPVFIRWSISAPKAGWRCWNWPASKIVARPKS
jgi:ribosomal 30S subunit maturation factor RimM